MPFVTISLIALVASFTLEMKILQNNNDLNYENLSFWIIAIMHVYLYLEFHVIVTLLEDVEEVGGG